MERITLSTADGPRHYSLAPPPAAHAPLVIFLHGAGGSAGWADDETGWSRLAAQEGFALALPEGLPPHPQKPPKFLTNPLRWNDGSPGPVGTPPTADDVSFLAAVLDDVSRRWATDPKRVYLTGFSNGAGMTFRAAAELAPRLAAIAPVAGYCWLPDPKPARPLPTFYLIGAADPLIPWRGGQVRSPWRHRYLTRRPVPETLERWAAALGNDTLPQLDSDTHGIRRERYPGPAPFRVAVIDGLGHHWPGGLGRLAADIGGPAASPLDATADIWRFFQHHALP